MTAKGHVVLAITPPIAVYGIDFFQDPLSVAALLLGALLPDIDEPGSYIGRRTYMSSIFREVGISHRGFTHFLLIPLIIMCASLLFFSGGFWFWLGFGILMHDLGDMLTIGGIKGFFYPLFPDKKAVLLPRFLRFRTFSATEMLFVMLLLLTNAYFLILKGVLNI